MPNIIDQKMAPIFDLKWPGFYKDLRGAYCIVLKNKLFSVFYDPADNVYEAQVDALDEHGFFTRNLHSYWYPEAEDVIDQCMLLLRKYCAPR